MVIYTGQKKLRSEATVGLNEVEVFFGGIEKAFKVSSIFFETVLFGHEISVKWYGVIIAFGLTLAALFGGRIAYTWKINLGKMVDVLIWGMVGGIIGARAYYVIFEWSYYGEHLGEIFMIWRGGLAIYGGIIGGILAGFITCKVEKLNFLNLLDMVGPSLLIGQGIGRWGNYANQEAFGTITNGNFGMMSDKVANYIARYPEKFGLEGVSNVPEYIEENGIFVHPTFFYESVSCIVGFFVLYYILKKHRKFSGQIFLLYGIWYGTERAIVEGLRTDSLYIGSTDIRVSQVLSAALVLACLVIFVIKLFDVKKNKKPVESIDYYVDKDGNKCAFPTKEEKRAQKELKKQERKMKNG